MKVLWIINCVLPEAGKKLNIPFSYNAGWLEGQISVLENKLDSMGIIAVSKVKHILKGQQNNITYFVFPEMGGVI